MPKRSTQQNLRNFEAMALGLEPSDMVNAKLLSGSTKSGVSLDILGSHVDGALLIAERVEV